MAVISELVRVIAEIEGLEENFVSVYARSAREAGFISHHGRGRNAARMEARDAANLLIAVNASSLAKNVPETIVEYSGLIQKFDEVPTINFKYDEKIGRKGISFVDALSFLLECDESGANNSYRILEEARDPHFKRLEPHQRSSIRVQFQGPQPEARIVIRSFKEEPTKKSPSFRKNADFWYLRIHDKKSNLKSGDRRISTTITHRTLITVADLLRK